MNYNEFVTAKLRAAPPTIGRTAELPTWDLFPWQRDLAQLSLTRGGQGDCSSALVADPVKVAVLLEECGEVARAVLDQNGLQTELVQVAAVAVAWLEGLP